MKHINKTLVSKKVRELYGTGNVWYIDNSPEYACFHKEVAEYKKLASRKSEGLLLEIGAGRGRVLEEFKNKKIVAIDISETMINILKNKYGKDVYIIQADAENLPFKDCSFDLALAPAVVGHCVEPLKLALEMKRVIKNDGFGIISTTANSLSIPGLYGQMKSFFEHKSLSRNFLLLKQGYCRDSYFLIRNILRKAKVKIKNVRGTGILPSYFSIRNKTIEKLSNFFPFKFFCRVIIVSFSK